MAGRSTRLHLLVTISVALVVALLTFMPAKGQTWRETYPGQFDQAYKFFSENRGVIDSIAVSNSVNAAYLCSIVAPEVGHYLATKDVIETSIVELFYVQMGSDHGNFSIGPFQMQPAFAERVEHYVRRYRLSRFYDLEQPGTMTGRARRVDKIKKLEGSMEYLCAFAAILERMHFRNESADLTKRLPVAAVAYNSGFGLSKAELDRRRTVKSFPRFGVQLPYSDMSVEFYAYYQSMR